MNLINKLISNLKFRKYSSSKLRNRFMLKDYDYLKDAFKYGSNYIRIQAVDYMACFKDQNNFDFLISEFKTINDTKLKSYTYQSIIFISQEESIIVSDSAKMIIRVNKRLLNNIGIIKDSKGIKTIKPPIVFRDKLKDHLKDLDDKKRLNENMTGF